jgi:glycosyltransferase involved in cell wall biosynthesis
LGRPLTETLRDKSKIQSGHETMAQVEMIQRPRNVLFFDHTAELGGGEIALLNLVVALDHKRYTPIVVLASDGPLRQRLEAANISTLVLPLAQTVVKVSKDSLGIRSMLKVGAILSIVPYVLRLRLLLRKHRVDLVHTNSLKADLIGGIAGRLAGVRVLWHVRDRIADDYLPPRVAQVFRRLCRIVPHVVVANSGATMLTLGLPSGPQRSKTELAGIGNFYVVHDGVPARATSELPARNDSSSGPLIGLVGRISPWKGQHIFVEAAAQVRRRFPNARFQIIGAPLFGEESYTQQVRDQVNELGLTSCVEFTGFRTDVPMLIQALDILVHASTIGEPFGQVVIEGMVAGKPVIATNGGGVPEIVQDGVTGLLAPMGDAAALAQHMETLLSDPQRASAMGTAGRERVLNHFMVSHTARKIERVYDSILNSTPVVPALTTAQSKVSSLSSDGS